MFNQPSWNSRSGFVQHGSQDSNQPRDIFPWGAPRSSLLGNPDAVSCGTTNAVNSSAGMAQLGTGLLNASRISRLIPGSASSEYQTLQKVVQETANEVKELLNYRRIQAATSIIANSNVMAVSAGIANSNVMAVSAGLLGARPTQVAVPSQLPVQSGLSGSLLGNPPGPAYQPSDLRTHDSVNSRSRNQMSLLGQYPGNSSSHAPQRRSRMDNSFNERRPVKRSFDRNNDYPREKRMKPSRRHYDIVILNDDLWFLLKQFAQTYDLKSAAPNCGIPYSRPRHVDAKDTKVCPVCDEVTLVRCFHQHKTGTCLKRESREKFDFLASNLAFLLWEQVFRVIPKIPVRIEDKPKPLPNVDELLDMVSELEEVGKSVKARKEDKKSGEDVVVIDDVDAVRMEEAEVKDEENDNVSIVDAEPEKSERTVKEEDADIPEPFFEFDEKGCSEEEKVKDEVKHETKQDGEDVEIVEVEEKDSSKKLERESSVTSSSPSSQPRKDDRSSQKDDPVIVDEKKRLTERERNEMRKRSSAKIAACPMCGAERRLCRLGHHMTRFCPKNEDASLMGDDLFSVSIRSYMEEGYVVIFDGDEKITLKD